MRLFADFWWWHLPPQTSPISQAFVANPRTSPEIPTTLYDDAHGDHDHNHDHQIRPPSILFLDFIPHTQMKIGSHLMKASNWVSKAWRLLCPKIHQNDLKPSTEVKSPILSSMYQVDRSLLLSTIKATIRLAYPQSEVLGSIGHRQ